MRDHFQEVLSLQAQFSSENTPSMSRRGNLIRNVIPEELRTWPAAKKGAALPFTGRLNVQGRDGTGRKTLVPWVRVHSPELSPSAQNGWYVVYLFKEDGSGLTLGLSHGSTRFNGREFVPRTAAEADKLMNWGRTIVANAADALNLDVGVNLGSFGDLALAYQRTTTFSKSYSFGNIPTDDQLSADLSSFVSMLGLLYQSEQFGDDYPVGTFKKSTEPTRVRSPSSQQGFGLSASERALVENRAMSLAHDWLVDNQFSDIQDVHLTHSCDFVAMRNSKNFFVEVKGSTSATLDQIQLTKNEVSLHLENFPNTILITVSDVNLDKAAGVALGGLVTALIGWEINTDYLRATQFSYSLKNALDPQN